MPGRLRRACSRNEKRGVETKARGESRANRECSIGKYADVVIANGNAVSLYNFQTNEASESDIMIRSANIRTCDTVKEHGQF